VTDPGFRLTQIRGIEADARAGDTNENNNNQLGLGIMMFIIFVIGSFFIANAAEIAAAVFAGEAFLFWIMAEVEQTITKVDSFFALIFFIIAIAILVIRRDANSYSY
jgi:hypothetical protein